jgi:uncharacterized protein YqjF (DUF2071 family)
MISGDFDYSIVESTAHRPWSLPHAPWLMTQSWHDLLFAHWRVGVSEMRIGVSEMRRAVPAAFDLDLFDSEAWLGVVPFHMTNVGLRATPAVPWISAFPELNVRTYVRAADRPGVYFFSVDAARSLAVAAARAVLNLPYYTAAMSLLPYGAILLVPSQPSRPTLPPRHSPPAVVPSGRTRDDHGEHDGHGQSSQAQRPAGAAAFRTPSRRRRLGTDAPIRAS